jgi:hypothetical protein
VSEKGADGWQSAHSHSQPDLEHATFPDLFGNSDVAGLDSLSVEFLPDAGAEGGQSGEMLSPRSLGNGPSSLNLCVYALLGAGLFKSTPRLKRLSFGIIPDWYHDSGPYQIGRSRAISPDCLFSVPAFCFIQPGDRPDDSPSPYRLETVVSLWRLSQFSPGVFTSRGPPAA